ncbi:amidohydrolase family protein [Siccirubricoccus sp. KC 17139]|uniref:Amidohydrolase family protein n=1 Tax=Siccirubricoccus soli TaxID=2899147 RepID=A0ABT1D2A6_9PROT|nr:amidohydrolase family protein [Siccirubricoccus soli]MCO6415742.1 amidohydrolase family protein [Siccirubricoccus soli]MCP2681874.1 amidohydrolase family protein [Siccirubricoccus soli]
MALEAATGPAKGRTLVRNIGLLLSGDLAQPVLAADAILIEDGRIAAIGRAAELKDRGPFTGEIDAHGCAVSPGLVDSHVHPVVGDWTPRQNQIGWVESFLNGGVTTMVSAGEVHSPGRPRDITGLKAHAIFAQRSFFNLRPAGVKVLAGAPVLEKGMVESDFAELAAAGVSLLGEIGLGSVKAGYEAREMVAWARKHGIQSTIHTGGPSVPGSGYIDKDTVLEADADIIGHINGGHTSLPEGHVCELCERSSRAIEIVHNGNERVAIAAVQAARDLKQLHRVILGTDSPAGSGVQPLGILRLISLLSSLGGIPAAQAIALATGNTARIRNLDAGLIEAGRAADLVFLDRAQHTAGRDLLQSIELGDIPGIGGVMIDGAMRCFRSRNTPPAERVPEVLGH